jgi:hypothetical protein
MGGVERGGPSVRKRSVDTIGCRRTYGHNLSKQPIAFHFFHLTFRPVTDDTEVGFKENVMAQNRGSGEYLDI